MTHYRETPNGTIHCLAPDCRQQPRQRPEWDAALADVHAGPRLVVPGSDLCTWHEQQLSALLSELSVALGIVRDAVLVTPSGATDGGGRVDTSTVRDVGALWNPAAARVVDEIEDFAGYLVRRVLAEYQLTAGERHTLTPTTDARVALAAVARHYGVWFARYPTIGPDVLRLTRAHLSASTRALGMDPVRRVHLTARCSTTITDTELGPQLCEGPLVGVIRPNDTSSPSVILCTVNPAHEQIPRSQWLELIDG